MPWVRNDRTIPWSGASGINPPPQQTQILDAIPPAAHGVPGLAGVVQDGGGRGPWPFHAHHGVELEREAVDGRGWRPCPPRSTIDA